MGERNGLFPPLGAHVWLGLRPTAYVVGSILAPLRGWSNGYATAAAATELARLTIRPMPWATAVSSALSARLMTSVTISTGSNCWRTTASARPALNGDYLVR